MKLLPQSQLTTRLRDGWIGLLEGIASAIQVIVPGGGSAICFAVGKFVVGLILAVITLAVIMRLLWRRKHADRVLAAQKLPFWAKALSFFGALVGAAVLVEATKLPVRFDQPEFSMAYWLIVLTAIWFIYLGIRSLFKTWIQKPTTSTGLIEKQ
jgi:multisubunit Na+/H+ antiporter MnhE subunit